MTYYILTDSKCSLCGGEMAYRSSDKREVCFFFCRYQKMCEDWEKKMVKRYGSAGSEPLTNWELV